MKDPSNLCGTKLGNYRLEKILGRGRMGIVYLARDEALLRPTAVKILSWQTTAQGGQDPEAWFLAEARSVARINHPNVVQIYAVARQEQHCYIAMEYMASGSVEHLVSQSGPLSALRATEILVQCASALQAAHEAGIIHRDIKPENLLMGADARVKLGDFGMALHLAKPRPNEPARAGTPFYTAPEIWAGSAATPATDLYALGATYFFMLTAHVPFEGAELARLVEAHVKAPIPLARSRAPQVPEGCEELIRRCLAKSPRDRFADAKSLGEAAQTLCGVLQHASLAPAQRPSPPMQLAARKGIGGRPPLLNASPQPSTPTMPRVEQLTALLRWLETGSARSVVVIGDSGSGRTTLLEALAIKNAERGTSLYFDGKSVRIRGAGFDAYGESNSLVLEEVVERQGPALVPRWHHLLKSRLAPSSLFIIDTPADAEACFQSLGEELAHLEAPTSWKIAVAIDSTEKARWRKLAIATTSLGICEVPPLPFQQALTFAAAQCLRLIRMNPPLMVTPDAQLLIAHFGRGNLRQITRLIGRLATLSEARNLRSITSWDVWYVYHVGGTEIPGTEGLEGAPAQRPEGWPTPQVIELLNRCRGICGLSLRQ